MEMLITFFWREKQLWSYFNNGTHDIHLSYIYSEKDSISILLKGMLILEKFAH